MIARRLGISVLAGVCALCSVLALSDVATAAAGPEIDSQAVRSVGVESATLQARINPQGSETTYRFEYGPTTAYGTSVPVPDASVGAGLSEVEVEINPRDLQLGTTYHYRVVATNSQGIVDGPDRTFTTQGLGVPFQLPDDRAYEMVSPTDKNGGDVNEPGGSGAQSDGNGIIAQASVSGNQVVYTSTSSFGDAQATPLVSTYLATRGTEGWSTHAIDPSQAPSSDAQTLSGPTWLGFTPDLSTGFFWSPNVVSETDAIPDQPNLYLHNGSGSWQSLTVSLATLPEGYTRLGGFTPDGSHVLFDFTGTLTPGAVAEQQNLYEWTGGQFTLINVLPDGKVDPLRPDGGFGAGDIAGKTFFEVGSSPTDISTDGSRVFWSDCNPSCSEGKLFVSKSGAPSVQLDASQGGPDSGGGEFWAASSDGSQVFFTDAGRLTADLTACENANQCSDLYRFDTSTNQLTDLTVDISDALGAQVQGVLGASNDGSFVYFVAKGVLTTGVNSRGQSPIADANNLYVYEPDPEHPGQSKTTFITTLDPTGDSGDFQLDPTKRTALVTPDGEHLAFMSISSLTGYDNTIAGNGSCGMDQFENTLGSKCPEVFEYDAASNELVCASCNPSGAEPIGAASLPIASSPFAIPRFLSEDGARLFFDSFDALVPQDVNGRLDVYEYEAGQVRLISSGSGSSDARFADASSDGDDVYFTTRDPLVAQDQDQNVDLYDARVGGGSNPLSPPVCSGTGCQGVPPAPPIFATPSSVTFNGVGNFLAPSKAAVKPKKKHKPVKHKKSTKHKKSKKSKKGKKASMQIEREGK